MYVPTAFAKSDTAKLHEFMKQNGFGVLTSSGDGGLVASHLPLLFDAHGGPRGYLHGHMARANAQWREVLGEVMAVFSGPHAYVSPSWYEDQSEVPAQDGTSFLIAYQHMVLQRTVIHSLDNTRSFSSTNTPRLSRRNMF